MFTKCVEWLIPQDEHEEGLTMATKRTARSAKSTQRNVIRPSEANGLVGIDVTAVGSDLQDTLVRSGRR
jgi:hypothetical protein